MTILSSQRMHPSPTRLSCGVRHALGFGMVETLLTLAGLAAISAVAFASYQHVSAKSKVSNESDNLRELSQRVDNSFGLLGSFEGVSARAIAQDGLAPERLTLGDGWLTNAWDGPVNVEAYTVTRFGDGFSIVHHQVPARSCADFVAVNARDPWDVQVSDVSVVRNHGGQLSIEALANACANGDGRVAFVYYTGLVAGGTVATSPLQLPTVPPTVSVPTSSTPPSGPVGPAPSVGPSTGIGTILPAPVAPTAPSAPAPPSPPPVMVTTPPAPPSPPATSPPTTVAACMESVENRTVSCPSGSVGQVFQSRRHHCGPDPLVNEAWARTTTAGTWTEISNTCSPCPGPETRSLICPSGQVGSVIEQRSFVCSGVGSWAPWTQTSNTCNACPAPETRTLGCPASQFGAVQEQRAYVCSGAGAWDAWTPLSNTCATCPAPFNQTESQWVPTSASCPSGTVGYHTWEELQSRSRSGSYNCPASTYALPSALFTGWSVWANTGTRRNEVNTCVVSRPRCADGSLKIPAWFAATYTGTSGSNNASWNADVWVNPTPAEAAALDAAEAAATWTYNEFPGSSHPGGNYPLDFNREGYSHSQCTSYTHEGNAQFGYQESFQCVPFYGMHYCDYSSHNITVSFQVCRLECESTLRVRSNYPYVWQRDATPPSQSSTVCTGQSGCVVNTYLPAPPACTSDNPGQVIENVRWHHAFGSGQVAWRTVRLTCITSVTD